MSTDDSSGTGGRPAPDPMAAGGGDGADDQPTQMIRRPPVAPTRPPDRGPFRPAGPAGPAGWAPPAGPAGCRTRHRPRIRAPAHRQRPGRRMHRGPPPCRGPVRPSAAHSPEFRTRPARGRRVRSTRPVLPARREFAVRAGRPDPVRRAPPDRGAARRPPLVRAPRPSTGAGRRLRGAGRRSGPSHRRHPGDRRGADHVAPQPAGRTGVAVVAAAAGATWYNPRRTQPAAHTPPRAAIRRRRLPVPNWVP